MKHINLVDNVFSKNTQFESAILCTYGLNLNFLENYLMKFPALGLCDNICIFTDYGTYNGFLTEAYSPRWLNKKYLIKSMKSAKGVFHPKLFMFGSEKKAIIGIGSANLTREGTASNLELITVFEISENDKSWSPVLRGSIEFVRRIAEITKSNIAIDKVDAFAQSCAKYINGSEGNNISFVHNLDKPLIKTIKERMQSYKVSKIQILSPFYDSDLTPLKAMHETFPNCVFEIYLQQNKSNFPKEVFSKFKSTTSLFIYKNVDRYMHGKAILIHTDKGIVSITGSANYSRSALIEVPPVGNYEVCLIGTIESKTAEEILSPVGKKATKVKKFEEIETNPGNEFEYHGEFVEYIVEAILKDNVINVTVNADDPSKTITPKKLRLLDCNHNIYEETIDKTLSIELTPDIRKKVPGKIAVQILGKNNNGSYFESNISWVLELEDNSNDPFRRTFRRIYSDPFELISVLNEILETGDEDELRLFLLQFDIPLDLVLPPRTYQNPEGHKSKGNIEGGIPKHYGYIFSASIKDAYEECLNRLQQKLERHAENPQVNKISNFTLVLTSLYSLIGFIDLEGLYQKHKTRSIISPEEWSLIRDYYDMLIRYISNSWNLIWSKDGYRDTFNGKIAKSKSDEDEIGDVSSFEAYIAQEYNYEFEGLTGYATQTLQHFEELKKTLLVQTSFGTKVRATVFPNTQMYIQSTAINNIRDMIKRNHDYINNIVSRKMLKPK
jgi:HKD family nuclease